MAATVAARGRRTRYFPAALLLICVAAPGGADAAGCGKLNERPCTLDKLRKSCDDGLYENFKVNRCLKLGRGQSPFFAGFASFSGRVAELSNVCRSILHTLPPVRTGVSLADTAIACRRGYEIGFRCAAPRIFETLGENAQLAGRLDAALNHAECRTSGSAANVAPFRLLCAMGKAVEQAAIRPALCMAKVMTNGGFTELAAGDPKSLEDMCGVAGEVAFERAVRIALHGHRGDSATVLKFKRGLQKIRRLSTKAAKVERLFQTMAREPACEGVLY
jgi:hypothetical protein